MCYVQWESFLVVLVRGGSQVGKGVRGSAACLVRIFIFCLGYRDDTRVDTSGGGIDSE